MQRKKRKSQKNDTTFFHIDKSCLMNTYIPFYFVRPFHLHDFIGNIEHYDGTNVHGPHCEWRGVVIWSCGAESCKLVLLLTSLTALVKFLRPHSHSFFVFKLRITISSMGCRGEARSWQRQTRERLLVSVSFSSHLPFQFIEAGAGGKLRPFNSIHGFLGKKKKKYKGVWQFKIIFLFII